MNLSLVRSLSIAGLSLLVACTATAPEFNPQTAQSANSSSLLESPVDRIKADMAWLADDAREGREAGTPGYEAAAEYVATRMKAIGLTPGAGASWFQQVPLRASTPILDAAAISIIGPDGAEKPLKHLQDFRVFPGSRNPEFSISAPAVFVGYGVHSPQDGYDDYAGLDLDGKIAVYLSGAPDVFDSEKRAHFGSGAHKSKEAAARGAIGTLTLFTKAGEKRTPWPRFIANPSRTGMTWIRPDGLTEVSAPAIRGGAVVNANVAQQLFEGAPRTFAEIRNEAAEKGGAPKGFDLSVALKMAGALEQRDVASPNVIGMIKGADPALKDEYVVLTAHLDHTGVNQKLVDQGKDGINNGAMDNAAGVAVMLEVARSLAANPPKRSVIVLAVTAEEKGLLGADYYAHYPTTPIEKIVANVNLDMPLMFHEFTDVVAFGAERSSLGDVVRRAAEAHNIALAPDPIPEQGIFTRSDHYRFVEKGVPAVFLIAGFSNGGAEKFQEFLAKHYHKPSDEIDLPIRYNDLARFTEVNEKIAREIADDPDRPHWNEGDFFGELFADGK